MIHRSRSNSVPTRVASEVDLKHLPSWFFFLKSFLNIQSLYLERKKKQFPVNQEISISDNTRYHEQILLDGVNTQRAAWRRVGWLTGGEPSLASALSGSVGVDHIGGW